MNDNSLFQLIFFVITVCLYWEIAWFFFKQKSFLRACHP